MSAAGGRRPLAWLFLALFLVFAFVFLSALGCASVEALERTQAVRVGMPVAVSCVDPADIPGLPEPTPIDVSKATPAQKAAATVADVEQFERFSRTAHALLGHCVSTGAKP